MRSVRLWPQYGAEGHRGVLQAVRKVCCWSLGEGYFLAGPPGDVSPTTCFVSCQREEKPERGEDDALQRPEGRRKEGHVCPRRPLTAELSPRGTNPTRGGGDSSWTSGQSP